MKEMRNETSFWRHVKKFWFSWQGECRDNVIPGSLLSSGYYEYEAFGADEYIVQKPEDTGKDYYYVNMYS